MGEDVIRVRGCRENWRVAVRSTRFAHVHVQVHQSMHMQIGISWPSRCEFTLMSRAIAPLVAPIANHHRNVLLQLDPGAVFTNTPIVCWPGKAAFVVSVTYTNGPLAMAHRDCAAVRSAPSLFSTNRVAAAIRGGLFHLAI